MGLRLNLLRGVSKQSARRPEAHSEDPRLNIAGADGGHHIVAAAAGNRNALRQAEYRGAGSAQKACGLVRLDKRRQLRQQRRIDCIHHLLAPAPVEGIEPAGAGRITIFSAVMARQPVIQIFMGQKELRDAPV